MRFFSITFKFFHQTTKGPQRAWVLGMFFSNVYIFSKLPNVLFLFIDYKGTGEQRRRGKEVEAGKETKAEARELGSWRQRPT